MAALRCSMCGISWPLDERFDPCPGPACGRSHPDPVSNIKPDFSMEEALSEKKRYDFERFYEEWDAAQDPKRLDEPVPAHLLEEHKAV